MAFSTDDVTLKTIDQEDFFETTLKTAVTDATDTNIYLNALPTPSEGFLTIEPTSTSKREVIFYTSKGADYVTCPSAAAGRGVSGTAQGHDISAVVRLSDTKNYWTTLRDRLLDVQTGWTNADENWTCSGDDAITVPTNATVKYSVGDKISLLDDGVQLYAYVTAVAATELTITGGSDYTLASGSTITEPKYSKAASPVGFPAGVTISTNTTLFIEGRKATVIGTFAMDTGTANLKSKEITHGFTFAATPKVSGNAPSGWSAYGANSAPVVNFTDTSTTAFTCRVTPNGAENLATGAAPTIDYIAIGKI